MKKHVLLAAALCMTAVMATACGSKHTQTQETAAETTTSSSSNSFNPFSLSNMFIKNPAK